MQTVANVSNIINKLIITLDEEIIKPGFDEWQPERVDTMKAGHCFVFKRIKLTSSRVHIKILQPRIFGNQF